MDGFKETPDGLLKWNLSLNVYIPPYHSQIKFNMSKNVLATVE